MAVRIKSAEKQRDAYYRDHIRKVNGPHLPSDELVVKMIAMQGYTDDEIEAIFGLPCGIMAKWKSAYPSFAAALEDGRTVADANVVAALYKNCIGYTKTKDVLVGTGQDAQVITLEEEIGGDTNAQKFWLQSRSKSFQPQTAKTIINNNNTNTNSPIGVRNETKLELMASILNLVKPADYIEGEAERVE